VQHCTCARTKENNAEINLHRLALGGQTLKNLRSLACKFELDQSERKSSQVHASHGQPKSQVNESFQLATLFGQGSTYCSTWNASSTFIAFFKSPRPPLLYSFYHSSTYKTDNVCFRYRNIASATKCFFNKMVSGVCKMFCSWNNLDSFPGVPNVQNSCCLNPPITKLFLSRQIVQSPFHQDRWTGLFLIGRKICIILKSDNTPSCEYRKFIFSLIDCETNPLKCVLCLFTERPLWTRNWTMVAEYQSRVSLTPTSALNQWKSPNVFVSYWPISQLELYNFNDWIKIGSYCDTKDCCQIAAK